MEKLKVSDYRKIAKESLRGQWGINAGFIFLNSLLVMAIGQVTGVVNNGSVQSVMSFLISTFVLFAFSYATYYVGLFVVRGGRADLAQLFVVFQGKYYLPVLIINVIYLIVQYVLGFVIFIPLILQGGLAFYFSLVIGAGSIDYFSLGQLATAGFVLLFLITLILFLFVTSIVGGLFRFAAYLRFDYPELSAMDCIKKAWDLIKDRWGQYILLELSFIGWYILGTLLFVIPLLWAIAYSNTAIAAFYDQALKEKLETEETIV
ncbi:DUF975 family protein [Enterococcus pallens]|uniref:Integral membrane protein n=1 Tax=Enterococcus pallens ATCC BAA-351 TaxID=1158607 RepID=R2SRR7_9ENTE|nr:DUF975 family protein [Enterococcus pallens]EOH97940.1 hypothetical protein UAU_00608 [Enterococcus pallens ATCC BAA-351]EOU20641.1 hypothetical protein I588_01488 [Enterococcus pallens ATCC BAA-351]OJG80332.1 hypothetical protein RV10_GL004544 [Enterococcus pallens]